MVSVVSVEQHVLADRPSPLTVLEWLRTLNVSIKNSNNDVIDFDAEVKKWNSATDLVQKQENCVGVFVIVYFIVLDFRFGRRTIRIGVYCDFVKFD